MLEVTSYFMTEHEIEELEVLKSSTSIFRERDEKETLEAALFVAYNFHWDNLADLGPRLDFCARVEKPANR